AFFASIAGIMCSIVFSKWISFVKNKNEKGVLSTETIAINKLIEAIEELRNDFSSIDKNGNKIKAGNVLRDLHKESTKQSDVLQTFSNDLADLLTISGGFEEVLNNSTQGVVAELKLVKAEIGSLKDDFTFIDEGNNKIKAGNVLRDLYKESTKQSNSLQTFSSDLALTISAGFEQILNNPTQGVVAELKLVKAEIGSLKDDFTFIDEGNNKIKAGNVLRDLYKESTKQSNALQTFSSDLALTISAGFEEILNNPTQGVVAELKLVKAEIENLGNKLQDPATDMTQNIVKELQQSMSKMVQEFKTSMSGDTKNEMEHLAKLLGQAGSSLTEFPIKLQSMTDNLNANFKDLQNTVKKISQQTLSQSENSTSAMKKQVEEMAEMVKMSTLDFQASQQQLIKEQSDTAMVQAKESVYFMKNQVEEMAEMVKISTLDFQNSQQQLIKEQSDTAMVQAKESVHFMKNQVSEMSEVMKNNTIDFQTSQLSLTKNQADQIFLQSEKSITTMIDHVTKMSNLLDSRSEDFQASQQLLLAEQSKNLQFSKSLLNSFNTSIENMNSLSGGVTESISKLNDSQAALTNIVLNFKSASQEINTSSSQFGESQLLFSKYSNSFLQDNSSTINQIQNALMKAKDVSADYAQKFEVIEEGLQNIFAEITRGLKDYQETVGESLEKYLGKYTDALTKTAESLQGASSKQEDILEELTEQLSKLNARKN
ncbi:MAG: hypothetical protein RL528_67, partial [Bacteroidota bacterium]